MKTGGSNYNNIYGNTSLPLIGCYHLHPDRVREDLISMYEHGQRKISVLCWYLPITWPVENDQWLHCVNSRGGFMRQQHLDNLNSFIQLIQEVGFNQFHMRFASQGDMAMPRSWSVWNASQFQENWSFINSVRNFVDAAKGDLKVVFDLASEYASNELQTNPILQLYVRRMWKLYTESHGPDDSCAFSVIHGGNGLDAMMREFRKLTPRLPYPGQYCFDAYGFEYLVLTTAAPVLQAAGELAKPVYMQETFYNDRISCAEIRHAQDETALNFQCIFQWNVIRDETDPHNFPDVYPKRFDNYLVEL